MYPASEGNLDIQYAVALAAASVDVRFYSVGGRNFDFIPDLEFVSPPSSRFSISLRPWEIPTNMRTPKKK